MPKFLALAAAIATAALACSLATLSGGPAMASSLEYTPEARANLSLTSFSITPAELHLAAGRPVMLRVSNDSGMAHDLTAPEFFAKAALTGPPGAVRDGRISLQPHQQVIIRVVPAAGRYPAKCSHLLHRTMGMAATIIVSP